MVDALNCHVSERSVVRLSRQFWELEVAGSNPAVPTRKSLLNKAGIFLFHLENSKILATKLLLTIFNSYAYFNLNDL
jgi:hypothetical protein